jgi:hypothetical protein
MNIVRVGLKKRETSMNVVTRAAVIGATGLLAIAISSRTAVAGTTPSATGQPNQSCEDQPTRPGKAASAQGSAFNPDGIAGTHYAGEQPQNSKNPKSVSQYDVACFQVSFNH